MPVEEFSANGELCLNCLPHPRGPPHLSRLYVRPNGADYQWGKTPPMRLSVNICSWGGHSDETVRVASYALTFESHRNTSYLGVTTN